MKLTGFQIENFRSITKVKCEVSERITLFAGKNESGKTNILEALSLINDGSEITEEDRPAHLSSDQPTLISYDFELNNDEINELRTITGQEASIPSNVIIKYLPEKKEYDIAGESFEKACGIIESSNKENLNVINTKILEFNPEFNARNISNVNPIKNLKDDSVANLTKELVAVQSKLRVPSTPQNPNPPQNALIAQIDMLIAEVNSLRTDSRILQLEEKIWSMRPKVVAFSSFEDTLPHEIPFDDFTNPAKLTASHPIVHDLITLAELDVSKLKTGNKLKRQNIIQVAMDKSTRKFSAFWKQNPIEFVFVVDQQSASIFIRDEGKSISYKPEQRSEGFQWFLSFYLRLEAAGQKKNNLVLVDEPGLYLHFRAQTNVLSVFEGLSKDNQILFTTHSPYLIDPHHLNRVRLVVRDDDQTIIKNSFHEGGTDFDTLTPITTAIGLDVSKDLLFSKVGYNIVAEGISDYYYLRSMIEYLKKYESYDFPDDISLVPCVGYATVSIMVSFLIALGLQYKILLDRKGTQRTVNKLKNSGIYENEILFSGKSNDESIEDLFDEKDIQQYLKSSNESKGIVARRFYEMTISRKLSFEQKTIENFKKLLDEIKKEINQVSTPDIQISKNVTKDVAREIGEEIKDKLKMQKSDISEN